jgi:L-glutamine-phosphate cytidylyltransferase
MKPTRAIILAAGQGIRLKPYTDDRPKCLVELAGKPLLMHQVSALNEAGIEDITVVTGFCSHKIEALGFSTVHNPAYDSTNMVASLMCAANLLDGDKDVLILYSDIIYEARIVKALLSSMAALSTTVDRQWLKLWETRSNDPIKDAETMRLNPDGTIAELGKKPKALTDIEGQYMGLIKVSAQFAPFLVKVYNRMDRQKIYDGKAFDQMFMTTFLQYLIDSGHPLRAVLVDGGWLEVDTVEDLQTFNRYHAQGRLKEFVCLGR